MTIKRSAERSGLDRPKAGEIADSQDQDSPRKETRDRFLHPSSNSPSRRSPGPTMDWWTPSRWSKKVSKPCPMPTSLGPLRADQLIQVRQLNGTDDCSLIPIEVQMQSDPKFPHDLLLRVLRASA
jgi:hypothetical protein